MKFGLKDNQYEILSQLVFKPLLAKGARVFVFGSRARGDNHPYSDIDILVKDSAETSFSSSDLFKIRESIEDSNLVIKVDLVRDQDLSQSYRPSVEKDMVEVHES